MDPLEQLATELDALRSVLRDARTTLAQAGFMGQTLVEQLEKALQRAGEAELWQRLYAQAVDPGRLDG